MGPRDSAQRPEPDPRAFARVDESDDAEFYRSGKYYDHFDWNLLAAVERIVRAHDIPDRPVVLDLMAGLHSHLPGGVAATRVVGLGLDRDALERNPALDEVVLHDLNREPCLPFPDGTFDLVLCVAAVEYMTRPVEVFREAARVLTPGGLYVVASSERASPRKAVRSWLEADVTQRVALVRSYLDRAGVFDEPGVSVAGAAEPESVAEDSRDGEDAAAGTVCAVYAEVPGVDRTRPRRADVGSTATPDFGPQEIAYRKQMVRHTLRCPYCDARMTRSRIPDSLLNEWDVESVYVCLGSTCPYYVRSGGVLRRQGVRGFSYRLMYHPERNRFYTIPDTGFGLAG